MELSKECRVRGSEGFPSKAGEAAPWCEGALKHKRFGRGALSSEGTGLARAFLGNFRPQLPAVLMVQAGQKVREQKMLSKAPSSKGRPLAKEWSPD